MRHPFAASASCGVLPAEQIQHGHANGDAIRDLIEDHAVRTIGHVGVDLDAAIHWSRMQDGS